MTLCTPLAAFIMLHTLLAAFWKHHTFILLRTSCLHPCTSCCVLDIPRNPLLMHPPCCIYHLEQYRCVLDVPHNSSSDASLALCTSCPTHTLLCFITRTPLTILRMCLSTLLLLHSFCYVLPPEHLLLRLGHATQPCTLTYPTPLLLRFVT